MSWWEFNQTNSTKRQQLRKEENLMPRALIISVFFGFALLDCWVYLGGFTPAIRTSLREEMWLGNGGTLWVILYTAACNFKDCGGPSPLHCCLSTSPHISKKCLFMFLFLVFWVCFFFLGGGQGEVEGTCWFPRLGVILHQKHRKHQAWRMPQVPEEWRIFTSLDEFLREYKLNLARKVRKIHQVQQDNEGAPTQEKQKIRWNYRKKNNPELISQYAKLIPCWTGDLWS